MNLDRICGIPIVMSGQSTPVVSLALLSSSGIHLLADAIRTEMRAWGWDLRIWQSGFNQYRQDIADQGSALYLNPPRIVLLHLDGEDLFADCLMEPFRYDTPARIQRANEAAREVERHVNLLQERLP